MPSWDTIKSQQSNPLVIDEWRGKRDEGGFLLKDALNLLHSGAFLPSTLCKYKLNISGALSPVHADFPQSSLLGAFLFSNVFLVMLPVLARLTGLSLEGSKPHYLSISLTTSMNLESKPLPWGSQGSEFNATPLRQTQELQWKCMRSLKLLEGNVATWFYFSLFMKLFLWIHSSRMTHWRLIFCFSSPTKSREDETHQTAIQCCHIQFKCYITMGGRRTALSVQTQVMPSSQSGDANY